LGELVTDVKVIESTDQKTVEKEELVSKSVLEDYKKDMFKNKDRAKAAEARVQQLLDEKALVEKQTLEESAQWKTLYEREKEERSKISNELTAKSDLWINSSKKNAVINQLGGFKKSEYSKFIDTSKIDELEDGTFDSDSIVREVDRIKQEFPELLIGLKTAGKMPNEAPTVMGNLQDKALAGMSSQELINLYAKVNINKKE